MVYAYNGLLLNPTKFEAMWLGSRSQVQSGSKFNNSLKIADIPIVPSNHIKLLGVTFDSFLNFDLHVSEVCRAMNYHLRGLSHIRQFMDIPTANMIASSIVSSRLDYCNSLLAGLSSYNLLRLQRVQNRAARLVLNVKGRTSSGPLLRQLHWLPVASRIDYKILLLTYNAITTSQPAYINALLVPHLPTKNLRSIGQHLLVVPFARTVLLSRAFSVTSPRLWNLLPQPLRDLAFPLLPISSINVDSESSQCNFMAFKRGLKTFLFDCPLTSTGP